jgi:integrase
MDDVDVYIHAATRDNTRRSYQQAIRHFEVEWSGFLPASAESVARYLAHYAPTLSVNTLRQRLAALAQWHLDQGFPDPTKAPIVRKVLRGIQARHPVQEKQARPLQLDQLRHIVSWLDAGIGDAVNQGNIDKRVKFARDKAFVLLGFWRGFRGDELTNLRVEHVQAVAGQGLVCFLPQTKADHHNHGTTFKAPALNILCPVEAYLGWIEAAHLVDGPVFRAIDRWGHISDKGLHVNSLVPLIRSLFASAGIEYAEQYSSHSLRRGFANWAASNGWDLKTLMEYVGWRDAKSAMRYIDAPDPFRSSGVVQIGT